jgi:succinyl-CoA synthetase beta subunit
LHGLIEKAKREKRHLLEPEVLSLLESYEIQIPPYKVIHNEKEAFAAAKSLGWPVVMKIVSPNIIHKTDVGGVILDIQNEKQVSDAFSRLSSLESTDRRIEGIIIYPFQKAELEISVGMVRDSQFGPVITFGLGGIWIEVFRDIAYAIAPLSIEEAQDMLDSIQAHEILKDFRKRKSVDRASLSELLVRISRMAMKEVAIQEMDFNPIFPMEKGYFIADGRIIL